MSEQTKDGDQFTFDYEPIRGMPELKWQGKKPFTGTSYYPAQLKETYGEPDDDGWMNKLYWGDNMQVMSHLLKSYRGKSAESDETAFEEKQYGDIWTNDDYLQFMYERLVLCRELLSDTGSIYLHCDWHRSHYLRMIMDEVFSKQSFKNEIVWHYQTYQGQVKNFFPRKHDILLFSTKGIKWTYKLQKDTEVEKTIDFTRWNNFLNENNEITGANYPSTDSRFDGYYRRFINENHRKPGPNDIILKLEGNTVDSVWDIKAVDPKNLLER